MRILLISGHGGSPYDSGAIGFGFKEAVETRRMATAVAPLLRKYGFEVTMYDQSKDAFKVVTQGGSLPLAGIDYVMEFHMNAAANDLRGNGSTTGSEIFVHTEEKSIGVEQAILRRMQTLGFRNRGVKRKNFAVLRHVHRRGVSHALIETCFIDDKDDMDLYKARFYDIAHAIADGVAEGFGKTVKPAQEEDDEMVEKKQMLIDGKPYTCECIEKDGSNFVKLRSLQQAGFTVDYDKERKLPGLTAPQCRATVPEMSGDTAAAVAKLIEVCGLEAGTIDYLLRYEYGEELIGKLAAKLE